MQPLQIFLALALAFTAALAQTAAEAGLPQCAQEAFFAAIPPSGCQISDAHCICSNPSLLQAIHSAIQSACSPADQAAAAAFASNYCATSATSVSGSASATATETVGTSTVASLPSSISAPAATSAPSRTLVVDTTALTTSTMSAMMSSSAMTMTTAMSTASATSFAKPTNSSASGGVVYGGLGLRLVALAVGVGAMSVAFAEF
ncbi:hypothetical protein B0A55_02073 [Friedmanniomyces simplex]|uniref:CFEM domain-containing protein n=1 Tax=Friedmanniomyces simplex TaxID=329884 RepID=A0A4U0XU98_9PEZI|nr:hypothetical protein B0A55_02073 [Friedmanniomyces simplex]